MPSNAIVPVVILFCLFVVSLAGVAAGFRARSTMKFFWLGTIATIAPSLAMLGLFYSLAIYMRLSLGAWPPSIGERGFPDSLLLHARIAVTFFESLLLGFAIAWVVAFPVCAFVRRWRPAAYHVGTYSLSCLLCVGIMHLAPSAFLNWWWD